MAESRAERTDTVDTATDQRGRVARGDPPPDGDEPWLEFAYGPVKTRRAPACARALAAHRKFTLALIAGRASRRWRNGGYRIGVGIERGSTGHAMVGRRSERDASDFFAAPHNRPSKQRRTLEYSPAETSAPR